MRDENEEGSSYMPFRELRVGISKKEARGFEKMKHQALTKKTRREKCHSHCHRHVCPKSADEFKLCTLSSSFAAHGRQFHVFAAECNAKHPLRAGCTVVPSSSSTCGYVTDSAHETLPTGGSLAHRSRLFDRVHCEVERLEALGRRLLPRFHHRSTGRRAAGEVLRQRQKHSSSSSR